MEKVAFILGAGAHKPFDFPLGEELKDDIARSLDEIGEHDTRRALDDCGVSIDRFLSNNRGIDNILRPLIAKSLLEYERHAIDHKLGNWLQYIWACLAPGPSKGLSDRFVFITFNYDRTLEYRLVRACMGLWGMSKEEAVGAVDRLSIYHVYGSLGSLSHGSATYREYGDVNNFHSAGSGIKIIGETDTDTTFAILERIMECRYLFLLGCAFHKENMTLLSLDDLPHLHERRLVPCCYNFTEAEKQILKEQYSFMSFADVSVNWDALALLQNSELFQRIKTGMV